MKRLEFLGDAILGFVIGALYLQEVSKIGPEGRLTKLRASVCMRKLLLAKKR